LEKHWTERLFVENAGLYKGFLEEIVERAGQEIEGLVSILSEFQVQSGGSILDLACGIGRHSTLLAEKGFNVVGVDLSPTFIARAREIAAERGIREHVEFRVGDLRRIVEMLRGYEGGSMRLSTCSPRWDIMMRRRTDRS
jgi:2-polyprenyl-3-methyl-5-hydroxy-6-metoxy-1,4-benzoquinol methylase